MSEEKQIKCFDREGASHFIDKADVLWRPGVYGIVFREDEVLLVPQWDGYDVPGGGMDIAETMEEGLVREVKEETGLSITPGPLVDVYDNFYFNHKDQARHKVHIYMLGLNPEGELSTEFLDGDELEYGGKAEWTPVSKISELKWIVAANIDMVALINKAHQMYKQNV